MSTLRRANPLSLLAAAAALTLAVLATVDWVSAAVVLAGELALLALLRVPARLVLRFWPVLPAALLGGYATALLAEKTGEVLLELGPAVFTTGSVQAGVAIALRGLAIALPGLFLLAAVDPTDLADALAQKLHLPERFVLGALAAVRLVGLLVEEWRTLGLARRARGAGSAGGAGRLKDFPGQALVLLVQAVRRSSRLAAAMEARGFGAGPRTWSRTSTFSRLDAAVAATGVLLAAAGVGAALAAGTFNFILS